MRLNALHSMRIANRLALLAGILLALLALVGLMGVRALSSADDGMRRIYEKNTVPLVILGEALSQLYQTRTLVVGGLGAESSDAAEQYFRQVTAVNEKLAAHWSDYVASLSAEEERTRAQSAQQATKDYVASGDKVIGLTRSGDFEAASTLMRGESEKSFISARDALLQAMVRERDHARGSFERNTAGNRSIQTGMLALIAFGLLLGAGLSYAIATSISRPLGQAVAVAARVAEGDLTQSIESSSTDEAGQLLDALRRMSASLVGIAKTLQESANGVALGSREISSGSLDLSSRTEMQASALQQTAASMEELGTTVQHNADNARQASELATQASGVALRGGEVVGQVVSTMKRINESSGKIADITAVIDGIAFQTNILALNAAVEAARAGEQGRGFAVVAGEVRNLAQRSATAAREIKALIGASVERVGQGTALVDQAGHTMEDVVAAIRRVADIVGEISSASAEQSAGVAQISKAITQMDQTTQQNAALVEQSAAAAENLNGQAAKLVQAVSLFRLRDAGSNAGTQSLTRA